MSRELINLLEAQVSEADSTIDEVGQQRERNHKYYTLQKLGNERPGHSHYISPDVFDVTESKKAFLDETFNTGRQPVKIRPTAFGSQDEADQKTAYGNMVLQNNDWFAISQDGWHDAQVAKRMVLFLEWSPEETTERAEVQGLTDIALQQAMQQNPRLLDVQPMPGGQVTPFLANGVALPAYSGPVEQLIDSSQVRLTLIQPERYGRDGNVTYVKDATFAFFSEEIARSELIKRGFDPDQVSGLATDYDFRRNEEDSARKAHDSSWTRKRLHNRPRETQTVEYFRTWTWLDMSDVGDESATINPDGLGLFEIHWCNGEVLRYADGREAIHEAAEMPFLEWQEYKISHAEHGVATADVVAHTQRTNSSLKRLVVDNQTRTNTSRHVVQSGALKNPREFLDNRVGGTIWSKIDPQRAVMPLPIAPLSPLTMQAIEMLDQDKEERSGVSRLSQGLSTDAVRYQNADSMIERLTNNANKRLAKMARSFAQFTGSVMAMICRLAAAHDRASYPMEIGGQQVMVTPSQWSGQTSGYAVDAALTQDEGLRRAQGLLGMDAQMMAKITAGQQSGDPTWSYIYGPKQQHALFDDVFEALGWPDTQRYMQRPDSPEIQQALMQFQQSRQQQQALQMQQQAYQLQALGETAAAQSMAAKADALYKQAQTADLAMDNRREDEQLALEREDKEHKWRVDERELALEAQQGRNVARATNVAQG